MPDDQQISQSVDNVMAGASDDNVIHPDQTSPTFSLGSNPAPSDPIQDDSSPSTDNPTVIIDDQHRQATTAPTSDDDKVADTDHQDSNNDELDDIKQQALNQLNPIIGELDQSPEEKYRTLMMLIQASDDKSLIKSAFEAANNIEDKKAKAEALLNIVNEINYFSASQSASTDSQAKL